MKNGGQIVSASISANRLSAHTDDNESGTGERWDRGIEKMVEQKTGQQSVQRPKLWGS